MPLPDGRPTAAELSRQGAIEANGGTAYSLHPQVVQRAREAALGASRRELRRRLARDAQVTYLAMMDPHSGATNADRLKAADGAARVAGLFKEQVSVKVTHALGFKGFQGIEGARILDAPSIPALPSVPPSGGPGDGAKSG